MDVKHILNSLVAAGMTAHELDNQMHNLGYDVTPYAEIFCGIADAIYEILGESGNFEDSATSAFFSDRNISNTQRADGLFAAYRQNSAEPALSGATQEVLEEISAEKGIPVHTMINIVLSEWALRQQYIRTITKAV